MLAREALQWGIDRLQKAGVQTPALDGEILLAHSASVRNRRIERSRLLAHPEYKIDRAQLRRFKNFIRRRARHEPVAYIIEYKEFYGLNFLVNRAVLVPRSETETLVEEALLECRMKNKGLRNLVVVDVGTGSGCIVISIARQLHSTFLIHNSKFFATDISSATLRVARRNARRHGVDKKITFLRGNLLEPVMSVKRGRVLLIKPTERLIITANLPYLPTSERQAAARQVLNFEPRSALDGGRDGLKYYREMFKQLKLYAIDHKLDATIFCELCPHQVRAFKIMVRRLFSAVRFRVAGNQIVIVII